MKATELTMKEAANDDKQTWRIHGAGFAAHQPYKSKFKKHLLFRHSDIKCCA